MSGLPPPEGIDLTTLDRIAEVLRLRNHADPDDGRTEVIFDLTLIRNMLAHDAEMTCLVAEGGTELAFTDRLLTLLSRLSDLEMTSLGTAGARRIRARATAGRVASILARHEDGNRES